MWLPTLISRQCRERFPYYPVIAVADRYAAVVSSPVRGLTPFSLCASHKTAQPVRLLRVLTTAVALLWARPCYRGCSFVPTGLARAFGPLCLPSVVWRLFAPRSGSAASLTRRPGGCLLLLWARVWRRLLGFARLSSGLSVALVPGVPLPARSVLLLRRPGLRARGSACGGRVFALLARRPVPRCCCGLISRSAAARVHPRVFVFGSQSTYRAPNLESPRAIWPSASTRIF